MDRSEITVNILPHRFLESSNKLQRMIVHFCNLSNNVITTYMRNNALFQMSLKSAVTKYLSNHNAATTLRNYLHEQQSLLQKVNKSLNKYFDAAFGNSSTAKSVLLISASHREMSSITASYVMYRFIEYRKKQRLADSNADAAIGLEYSENLAAQSCRYHEMSLTDNYHLGNSTENAIAAYVTGDNGNDTCKLHYLLTNEHSSDNLQRMNEIISNSICKKITSSQTNMIIPLGAAHIMGVAKKLQKMSVDVYVLDTLPSKIFDWRHSNKEDPILRNSWSISVQHVLAIVAVIARGFAFLYEDTDKKLHIGTYSGGSVNCCIADIGQSRTLLRYDLILHSRIREVAINEDPSIPQI